MKNDYIKEIKSYVDSIDSKGYATEVEEDNISYSLVKAVLELSERVDFLTEKLKTVESIADHADRITRMY